MMQPPALRFLCAVVLSASIGLLTACAGKSAPATFYRLSTPEESAAPAAISGSIGIAVAPIVLPAELERSQILLRDTANRVSFSEFHRWAGSLQGQMATAVSLNLARLLGTDRISANMAGTLFPVTHTLHIEINRFDGSFRGPVALDATWSIRSDGQEPPLVVERSIIRQEALAPGYEGLVAAQSRAVWELSRRIAQFLRQTPE